MSNLDARRAPRLDQSLLLLCIAVLGSSLAANLPHTFGLRALYGYLPPFDGKDSNMVEHLGGENLQIARAIVEGRGFADPFGAATGPTAWMPPILPAWEAVLLALGGGVSEAATAILILQNLVLIYAGSLVLRAAGRSRWHHARTVALSAFVGLTWFHFHSCYMFTHDSWLVMLFVSLLVDVADRLWGRAPGAAAAAGWGLVGGASPLASPVLAPIWLVLTAGLAASSRVVRPWALAGVVAFVVAAPWAVRNYATFDRLIPVKSNIFYELYQSNCLEDDGILRFATGSSHPYRAEGEERSAYVRMGEVAYLDGCRARFLRWLRSHPGAFVAKVGHRLLAATILYFPFFDDEGGATLLLSYGLHPLPFLGLVLTVTSAGWWKARLKVIAVVVTVSYLAPYVLVAYYERYALPLLGVQAMFVFWAVESVHAWCSKGVAGVEAAALGRSGPLS